MLEHAEAAAPDPRLAVRHIQLLLDGGQVAEAEAAMTRALAAHPQAQPVLSLIALHALRVGDRAAADGIADTLQHFPDAVGAAAQLVAEQAERRGDLAGATVALDRAAEIMPAAWRIRESQARVALKLLDGPAVQHSFADVAASQSGSGPKRQPRHVLRALAAEMRVHAAAVEQGRAALAADDLAGLAAALRDEPGSTVLANALLRVVCEHAPPHTVAGNAQVIPQRLNQFWDATEPPVDVRALIVGWHEAHPTWTVTLYDTGTARAYIERLGRTDWLQAWRFARQAAHRADLFRLIVLHEEGGVYADADDRCLQPLDGLLGDAGLMVAQESYGSTGNNFIAVVPSHPVIRRALDDAVEATLSGVRNRSGCAPGRER